MNSNLKNVFTALRRPALFSSLCLAAALFGCNNASHPAGDAKPENAAARTQQSAPTDSALEDAVFTKSLDSKEACAAFDPSARRGDRGVRALRAGGAARGVQSDGVGVFWGEVVTPVRCPNTVLAGACHGAAT